MSVLFTIFLIGIGLSMDAFSLSLVYGTQGFNKRNEIVLAIIVGLFHFFMPLMGVFLGSIIMAYYELNVNLLISVIFGIIGVDMIVSGIRDEEVSLLSGFLGYLMFGFSVSIDSFTTGIGVSAISDNYLLTSFVFMLCSGILTFLGLRLGNVLNDKFGKISNIFGGVIFLLLIIYYLF